MPLTYYDPAKAPEPADWLALSESERMRVVQTFHAVNRIKVPHMKGHSAFHVIVENQIAQGFGPSVRAVDRLQREGLSRHDAVHAVASVVSEVSYEAMSGQSPDEAATMQSRMNAAIERLSASQWLASSNTGSGNG